MNQRSRRTNSSRAPWRVRQVCWRASRGVSRRSATPQWSGAKC